MSTVDSVSLAERREDRAARLRPVVQQAVRESSLRDVARRVGVSHTAVQKLVDGVETPYDRTLHKFEEWAILEGRWRQTLNSSRPTLVRERLVEPAALELFGSFDDVVRHIRGVAPPGQSQPRKLTAVEAIERYAAAIGKPLPDWFFDLRRQINEGEL